MPLLVEIFAGAETSRFLTILITVLRFSTEKMAILRFLSFSIVLRFVQQIDWRKEITKSRKERDIIPGKGTVDISTKCRKILRRFLPKLEVVLRFFLKYFGGFTVFYALLRPHLKIMSASLYLLVEKKLNLFHFNSFLHVYITQLLVK